MVISGLFSSLHLPKAMVPLILQPTDLILNEIFTSMVCRRELQKRVSFEIGRLSSTIIDQKFILVGRGRAGNGKVVDRVDRVIIRKVIVATKVIVM